MIEFNFNGVDLRVYEDGKIERFYKKKWRKASDKLDNGYKKIMLNKKNYLQHRIIFKAFNFKSFRTLVHNVQNHM